MDRKDFFIMTEEELFIEPLKVAAVIEGLTAEEHKNAIDYLLSLKNRGKILELGCKNVRGILDIGYLLHECLFSYPRGYEEICEKQIKNALACEFFRLLPVDAIFVFDAGESTLPYNGRLWTRIKEMEKPIVYLMRNKENSSWSPYKCCQFVWNEETESFSEEWCFIGEIEEYKDTDLSPSEKDIVFYRHFNKESMTDREYEIAMRCILINSKCMGLEIRFAVSRDESLYSKVQKLLSEQDTILLKLQTTKELDESDLKNFEAQLDFIEADLEELSRN